jgi:hypothetical protein
MENTSTAAMQIFHLANVAGPHMDCGVFAGSGMA